MAVPHEPAFAAYLCGLISSREAWLEEARARLAEMLGPLGAVSEIMAFDFTDYYHAQMGRPLLRQFVSLGQRSPGELASIKQVTQEIEAEMARENPHTVERPVNLDPGYIELAKLVLASMKNFSHRIYLSGGVFAEVTLLYRQGGWKPLEWTFPDFASGRYHAFLSDLRDTLPRGRGSAR